MLTNDKDFERVPGIESFCFIRTGVRYTLNRMQIKLTSLAIVLGLIAAPLMAQDITGRWVGVADSTDEGGIKRQEKQNIEIKNENGKLSAVSIGRNGGSGAPLQIQQEGGKVNLYRFLTFEGGEHLRWKMELKDGKFVGTFSALHDNPKKWIYDRVGTMTLTRETPAPNN